MHLIHRTDSGGQLWTSDADVSSIVALSASLHVDLAGLSNVPPSHERTYIRRPINDGALDTIDLASLWDLAGVAARAVLRPGTVVVNCSAGINRSNFFAGLVLVRLGMPGRDAVVLIRARVPEALSNPEFAAYLITRAARVP